MSQFVVRFDFEDNRIWLKRTGDARVTQYGADYDLTKRVGATVLASRRWIRRLGGKARRRRRGLRAPRRESNRRTGR